MTQKVLNPQNRICGNRPLMNTTNFESKNNLHRAKLANEVTSRQTRRGWSVLVIQLTEKKVT